MRYHGVSWHTKMSKWRVIYNHIHIGYHDDQVEAARMYNNAAMYALDTRYDSHTSSCPQRTTNTPPTHTTAR